MEIVRRATAADPADRYQYVDELLRDLNDYNRVVAGAAGSLRPGALSRLSVRPFSDAASRKKQRSEPRQAAQKSAPLKPLEQPASFVMRVGQDFLARRLEVTLALAGLLVALALCGAIVTIDLSSTATQSVVHGIALAAGLATWLAPRPRDKVTALRLSSFAIVALLVTLANPGDLAVLRWKQNVRSGDTDARSRAVPLLVREGYRDFQGADLTGVSLMQIDLAQVSFRGASLREANLMGSMLLEADFGEADLAGAVLLGADLRGATLDDCRGLAEASCDAWTALPKEYECADGHLSKRTLQ